MKSTIFIVIAFLVLVFTTMFLINVTLHTIVNNNKLCTHQDRVEAVKKAVVYKGQEGSPDAACLVEWSNNGKTHTTEWWNVGWCNDKTPIEITVTDSTCH